MSEKVVSRDEILAMEPGRELDMIVAEKVMGLIIWSKEHLNNPYSTDISAAWEVFERLIATCPDTTLTHPWCIAADYNPMREETWRIHCEGDTAPEVICKAALLAVMDA